MKGSTLIASATTLEGARQAVSKFYAGSTITLAPTPWREDGSVWTVATGRGHIAEVVVRLVRGRYRFERLPDGFTIKP